MPFTSLRPFRACSGALRVLPVLAWALLSLLPAAQAEAELAPDMAKKLAKLEVKLAKRLAKQAEHTVALAEAQAALLAAQLAEMEALALPEGDELLLLAKTKALKAAKKAVTKWVGKGNKLGKKLVVDAQKLEALQEQIESIVPDYFDPSDPDGGDPGDPGGGDPGGGDPGGGDPGGGDPTGGTMDPDASLALLAVDCGDLNGYAAPQEGWQLLSDTVAPPGVSLTPAPLDLVHVAKYFALQDVVPFPSSVATIDPDQLGEARLFTSLQLANPTTLTLTGLPADTDLRVLLELGALGPWTELLGPTWTALATDSQDVDVDAWVSGAFASVLRDVRCITGIQASSWSTDLGGIVRAWVPLRTDGTGQARLKFKSSANEPVYLASFAVYQDEDLPIFYKRTPAGPLQSAVPAAAAFVSAFNADAFDAAEEAALALADDWLRGVALCHLVGWLDGSRDGRVHLLDEALEALVEARDAGHAGAVWLISQALSFRRAFDHLEAANTSVGKLCPEQGGKGFLNPDCAGQVYSQLGQSDLFVNVHIAQRELSGLFASPSGSTALHDLQAWNAGTLTEARWEPSPFLPRALHQWGVNFTLMNPQLAVSPDNPDSVAMHQDMLDVYDAFVDLGFAATDFPRELELRLFQAYAEAGSHPKDWEPAEWSLFTSQEIANSWWGAEVAVPADVAGAEAWADAQRAFLRVYRSAVAHWLEDRLEHGEFGGGQGDDVELLLVLFPLELVRQEGLDRRLLSGLDEAIRYGLEHYPDVGAGYYQGEFTDVEHTAEFTTDPFLAARAAFGFTARAARTALANAREILDAADPDSAFAAVNSNGRMRFRSYYFTADGPSDDVDDAIDVFLNGRATVPALALAGRGTLSSAHGALADPRAWAAGWRDDALSTSGGKPAGFPASAQFPSGALGKNGLWYSESGVAGDDSLWESGQSNYVLGLMLGAYRGSTAADRWQFLLPAVRMFRAAMDWEDAGQPVGAAGSLSWAASAFRNGGRFGMAVAAHYADLANDATLNSQPDPAGSGSTYVDAALLARMKTWVDTAESDQGSSLAYAVGDVFGCDQHKTKPATYLAKVYQDATTYYRNVFPLLTSRAQRTDRVFLNIRRVLSELQGAWTGDVPVEGLPLRSLVRWEGEGLDLAVSTNHRDLLGQAWSAFAYNFKATTQSVTLRLEEGLPPGEYLLEAGAGVAGCDVIPGAISTSLPVTKRGAACAVSFALPPGLNVVRLTRLGAAPAPGGWDLALDPPLLASDGAGGFIASVRVVNAGSSAAPSATLGLHVAAVNEDGSLASPASLPVELLLSSAGVTLGGLSGWTLPETVKTFSIPTGSPLADLLEEGYGLQLRAELPAATAEGDSLNNVASRTWFLDEVPPAE